MSQKCYNFKLKAKPVKRKAVSEVISSLLLVVITVVGALILSQFLDETFVAGSSSISSANNNLKVLKLLAYDTRDSADLLNISSLDNDLNGSLVGDGFTVDADFIPSNGGTEFMVLQIENRGLNSVFVEDVFVNGGKHDWDSDTANIPIDASGNDANGKYPKSGMFSLSDIDTDIQYDSPEISEGQKVNLLVKLSDDVTDITLNSSMRILLNIGYNQPIEFIIEAGDAK
jgi:flagellin-like protein